MIRTIIVPETNIVNILFSVPDSYIGNEMEIIAFSKKEGLEEKAIQRKNATFSALSINTKGFKFNREEANER